MAYIPKSPSEYQGNQVLLNSDRLIFNAKSDSILLFANETIGFSANGSFHFDTGPEKDTSKFIVNSPNIYLGLKFDNNLPTEPALLGNEFDEWANELLNMIDGLIDDIIYNVTYMAPMGLTAPAATLSEEALRLRRKQVKDLRNNIKYFKSEITKLS